MGNGKAGGTAAGREGAAPAGSRLPPIPDFSAIQAAAGGSADRRTQIFALIGRLTFSWSNNESMFIYVLMLLLKTDAVSAALVFGTLNTTRARIDLVQRLAKAKIRDPRIAADLEDLLKRFTHGTRIRNEFNHCMFRIDDEGAITHTHAMRIEERKGRTTFGAERPMDDARLAQIADAGRQMSELNRDLWSFLPRLEAHLAG